MNHNQGQWKDKVQYVIKVCHGEIKRTTDIGKKMILASKTNNSLRENYERLGEILCQEIEKGKVEIDHPEVSELIATIKSRENDLETIEKDVQVIKKFNNFNKEDEREP